MAKKSGKTRKSNRRTRKSVDARAVAARVNSREMPPSPFWPEFSPRSVQKLESVDDARRRDEALAQLQERAEIRDAIETLGTIKPGGYPIPQDARNRMVYDAVRVLLSPASTPEDRARASNSLLAMERNNQRNELLEVRREEAAITDRAVSSMGLGEIINGIISDDRARRKIDAFDLVEDEDALR